ncbi:MAG: hypothetical protein PWP64_24 [Candidatus Cloacimonadota bacterium]|nr:hypothetical protein [Candidatus Cloacimonadota bacterium]
MPLLFRASNGQGGNGSAEDSDAKYEIDSAPGQGTTIDKLLSAA